MTTGAMPAPRCTRFTKRLGTDPTESTSFATRSTNLKRSHPFVGEDDELGIEISRLTHASRLQAGAIEALDLLSEEGSVGDDDRQPAEMQIRQPARVLTALVELDPTLVPLSERLNEILFLLGDVNVDIRDYASSVESDPDRLDEAVVRYELIAQAKRKYGTDIPGLLELPE